MTQTHDNPKREYIRHTIDVPLEVRTIARPGGAAQQGVNVSHGGLAFTSDECMEPGALVDLSIPTVDPPFHAQARVVWCRPEAGRYLVGAQFLDKDDAFRSRMVQQVCSIENYRRDVQEREGRDLSASDAAMEWIQKYAGRFPDSERVQA